MKLTNDDTATSELNHTKYYEIQTSRIISGNFYHSYYLAMYI